MFHQVKRFVDTFRDLEGQERAASQEEAEQRDRLRKILSASPVEESVSPPLYHRVIVVAGLYPRAGASFIAGNLACCQAGAGIKTTLCEAPDGEPYFFFALNGEERRDKADKQEDGGREKTIWLQNGQLQVKALSPMDKHPRQYQEIAGWLLSNSKETSLMIIDVSTNWERESTTWLMEMADEIWFVLDTDIPRLVQTMLTREAPQFWTKQYHKIRLIANRWDRTFTTPGLVKMLEGTLALWSNNKQGKRIEQLVPQIAVEKVTKAQIKGKFVMEMYPEEGESFDALVSLLQNRAIR